MGHCRHFGTAFVFCFNFSVSWLWNLKVNYWGNEGWLASNNPKDLLCAHFQTVLQFNLPGDPSSDFSLFSPLFAHYFNCNCNPLLELSAVKESYGWHGGTGHRDISWLLGMMVTRWRWAGQWEVSHSWEIALRIWLGWLKQHTLAEYIFQRCRCPVCFLFPEFHWCFLLEKIIPSTPKPY